MTVPAWSLALLVAMLGAAVGCGSSSSEQAGYGSGPSTTGGIHGGQTGSLLPCSTPPQFTSSEAGSVPEGDAAFVFHSGCPSGESFSVLDEEGVPISFELEEIENGVVLLRTDSTLAPGNYTVVAPDGTVRTVTVDEAAPLPSRLGELARVGGACSNLVQLTFSDELLPYLPLLRLEFSLDGSPFSVWFEYATVPPNHTAVVLQLDDLMPGSHELSVAGFIAGEAIGPEPASLSLANCEPPAPDNGGCTLSPRATASHAASLAVTLSLLLVSIGVGRRRRRQPG